MSKWHGGKGSKPRPLSVDQDTYANNWERIFGNKQKNKAREEALSELTRVSQEMGLYDNKSAEHTNCGTPECCGTCDTANKENKNA